jgi:sulfatase maturation enzyme AslB (radical SAM superfamily)
MVEQYIKSNICPLPWTHLEVDVNGSASPCCLYKGTIDNYKVYDTDLKNIQDSDYMNSLRQQFRNGERPHGCANCWQEEAAGKVSKRQNSIYKMKHSLQNWTPDSEPTLKFIDFKLGNVCNLKCRICGSWSSSKWAQEEMDYGPNHLARQQLHEGGWPKRHPEFFDDIEPVLADVEYFEFTGGEPFMIQNHFKILEHCVAEGYAHKQDIHYNTNGTQLPDQSIFDLWKEFKHVEIAFSIDDVGERFEYQRHPADWSLVNANLAEFKRKAPASMDFQICSTINIFNIFSLAELADWVNEFGPKFFYVNTCFDPECFNIQTLPREIKSIATDRYHNIEDFRSTIDYMNAADRYSPQIQAERVKRIQQADLYRGENFADSFVALNNLLKIYD